MTRYELLKNATLWANGSKDTALYVKPTATGYDWIMLSAKTGTHIVKQDKGLEPNMTERVRIHWSGFQENQTR